MQWLEKQPKPRRAYTGNPQAESRAIVAETDWTKLLLVGRARNIMQDIVKCVLQIRSEV